ncbi:hypothetical protein K438DRAFT_1933403 [Mycena galopus ATCC 62051]|nr:hypothetical protein K438DRAFT_1933403 [Mycena galopus ATCC 62051]
MPPSSTTAVDRILEYIVIAASALQETAKTSGIPFVGSVCNLTLEIVPTIQNAKVQKERCLRIADDVHHLLCTLMALCTDEQDIQSPWMLERICQCTLIKGSIDHSHGGSQCKVSAKEAHHHWKMTQGVGIASALVEFNIEAKRRHEELLELISSQSNSFDGSSLLHLVDLPDWTEFSEYKLIATVVASEGCQATLQHWKQERTAMLSDGYDKWSNLEISISLSLSSPRMLLAPQAADLLSLMSLLSDGISDMDLAHSKPPIQDLLKCKSTLLRTSLAYVGSAGEFKVLTPIREYIERVRPPSPALVRPLRAHFSSLLKLWRSRIDLYGADEKELTTRLVSNLGNLNSLLEHGLKCDPLDLRLTMECVMLFSHLNRPRSHGLSPLLLGLPKRLNELTWMNIEAVIYVIRTEYVKARAIHKIILRCTSPLHSPSQYANGLVNIALLDVVTGVSAETVTRNLDAAESIYQNTLKLPDKFECALARADLQLREGHKPAARAEYIRLFSATRSENHPLACYCLLRRADSTNPVHNATEIARWAVVLVSFIIRASTQDMLVPYEALRCFGDVLAEQGMDDTALNVLTVALNGLTWMDVHMSKARCLQSIGDLHMRRGEFSKASKFWTEARPQFELSSQAKSVLGIDSRLAALGHHQAKLDQLSKMNVLDLPVAELSIATEASHQAEEGLEVASGGRYIGETPKVLTMV